MNMRKNEEGSITLEAAVFMPFFILFLVFLIFMIKFALVDIALNQASSETAKEVATQAYPIDKAAQIATDLVAKNVKYSEIAKDANAVRKQLQSDLSEHGFGDIMFDSVEEAGETVISSVGSAALTPIVKRHLGPAVEYGFIEMDKVKVSSVAIKEGKFIELVVEYEIVLPIPFITRTFKMQKKAYERLWIGT